jgi:DNA-binding NarL/FixJ family response regulator
MKIDIGIADDHQLFLKSLSALIMTYPEFNVCLEAADGQELLSKLELTSNKPDIILLDVDMPVLNGIKTAEIISAKYAGIKVISLSMKEDDYTVIKMLKAGCCAYLLKDIHPSELEKALLEVHKKGYYNGDLANVNYRRLISKINDKDDIQITEKEVKFLQLACSDLTYKKIADLMHLSARTIDGYRESLFEKFNVQSRVGMVLEGIRRALISF